MDEYDRPRRTHSSSRRSGAASRPARDAYEEDSYEPVRSSASAEVLES